jgi:hypothetical protein
MGLFAYIKSLCVRRVKGELFVFPFCAALCAPELELFINLLCRPLFQANDTGTNQSGASRCEVEFIIKLAAIFFSSSRRNQTTVTHSAMRHPLSGLFTYRKAINFCFAEIPRRFFVCVHRGIIKFEE